ncbi:MAG: RagB/SusD family nutrient uptake outer membrane protein [Proteiniphilum sp.]|nr:RagB/SusD family nutrient uptake outer membrane protein [Proteiniphilum sp.]
MNRYFYKFFGCCMVLLASSCVDLDQEPKSWITKEQYIEIPQNISQVQKSISGLYNSFWKENYGFSCRMFRIGIGSDEMVTSPKPNNAMLLIQNLTPNISLNTADWGTMWANMWLVITGSNAIISGTPIPTDPVEAASYKSVLGEAYFMRALSYFYLVRLYGDVPMVLTPEDAMQQQPRVSVATIYDQVIIPDCITAIHTLPSTSRSGNSATPSLWAAKTLLADVYLTMAGWPLKKGSEYYAKSAEQTLDIINNAANAGLSLTPVYGDLWKEAKKTAPNEHLFAIHNSVANKNPSQFGKSFYPRDYVPAGWADYYGNPDFMHATPPSNRKSFNYMLQWNTSKGLVSWENSMDKYPCIAKYYDYNQGGPATNALSNGLTSIYRYADVLLMYAEASNLATGNVNTLAQKCLNEVQNRAGSTVTPSGVSSANFDKAVVNERGWEFLAEYKRWFDLVRREKLSSVKPQQYTGSVFEKFSTYYFPVPQIQIQMTGWENNPGY